MAPLWLKAIPWVTILKQAPAVLAAADALLAKSRRRTDTAPPVDDQALRQRIKQIEELQQADAVLMKQLADQLSALAAAAEADAARTRLALILGIIGVVIGVAAVLVAWL